MLPTTLPCHFKTTGCRRSKLPRLPAQSAQATVPSSPIRTKTMPGTVNCSITMPFSGRTNCGKKARKKGAVCGMSTSVRTAWRKARPVVKGGHNALVQLSGSIRTLAVSLYKIGNDIRLMSCGPRAGFAELIIPDNDLTLKAATLKLGFVTEAEFDRVVDTAKMVTPDVAAD